MVGVLCFSQVKIPVFFCRNCKEILGDVIDVPFTYDILKVESRRREKETRLY